MWRGCKSFCHISRRFSSSSSIFLSSLVPLGGWRRRRAPGVPPPRYRVVPPDSLTMRCACCVKSRAAVVCPSSCISPRSARRLFVDRRYRSGSGPRVMAHEFRGCVSNQIVLPILSTGRDGDGEEIWRGGESWNWTERSLSDLCHGII